MRTMIMISKYGLAATALLVGIGSASATPVDFTLTDASANFNDIATVFTGTFSFDPITETASNVAIMAMPTNPSNPFIVSSYTATGNLCNIFSGNNFLCVTNAADTASLAFQFNAPLDGIVVPDPIIDINANITPGTFTVQDTTEGLKGSAVTGDGMLIPHIDVPEPGNSLAMLAMALAMLGLASWSWGTRVRRSV